MTPSPDNIEEAQTLPVNAVSPQPPQAEPLPSALWETVMDMRGDVAVLKERTGSLHEWVANISHTQDATAQMQHQVVIQQAENNKQLAVVVEITRNLSEEAKKQHTPETCPIDEKVKSVIKQVNTMWPAYIVLSVIGALLIGTSGIWCKWITDAIMAHYK